MILAVVLHMIRTYFFRGLQEAAGVDLVHRGADLHRDHHLRIHRLSSAMEPDRLLGDHRGHGVGQQGSLCRRMASLASCGGDTVTGETLSRFFVVHVIILPWVLTGLIAIHLVLMRATNLATLEPVGEEKHVDSAHGIPFFPVHVCKEGIVVMFLLAVLVTLSIVSPWEIGHPADPLVTPEHIKPEWYFLPSYQLLKYFEGPYGAFLGIIACSVPFLLLLLWPFLDRGKQRHPRRRPMAVGIGLVGLIGALASRRWATCRRATCRFSASATTSTTTAGCTRSPTPAQRPAELKH